MPRDDHHKPFVPHVPAGRSPSQIVDPEAERRLLASLSERHGVPAIDVTQVAFPLANLDLIPLEIARRHVVLPVQVRDDAIFLAMADPSEQRVIEEIEFVSGRRVFPYVADPEPLAHTIERAFEARHHGETHYYGPRAGQAPVQPGVPGAPRGTTTTLASPPTTGLPEAFDPRVLTLDEDLQDPDLRTPSTPLVRPGRPGPTLDSVFGPLPHAHAATVLVVDDEEDIRRMLRRVLEDRGYRVLEAERGSVALALVKEHVPDAIVLDAMLPELHGFDICRRIKSSARYGHIPILMISAVYRGWRFAEDLKSAYGVTAYLEKPFRIGDVVATVESMLAGATRADGRDPEALSAEAESALTAGMDAYKRGQIDLAIEHLQRGLGLDPLSYRLHYHLALLVGRKGDVFRAIQELETAVELNPKSFAALKNLAVLYQQAGFKHKAIEMWERAIGQSPDNETRSQLKEHLMSLL
jgi:DNA-binding response OmpR family regulator